MKMKFFSLALCTSILATSPLFAMDEDRSDQAARNVYTHINHLLDGSNLDEQHPAKKAILIKKMLREPRKFNCLGAYEKFMFKCADWHTCCSSITFKDDYTSPSTNNFFHNFPSMINYFENLQEIKISTISMTMEPWVKNFLEKSFAKNPNMKIQFHSWFGTTQPYSTYITMQVAQSFKETYGDQISFEEVD